MNQDYLNKKKKLKTLIENHFLENDSELIDDVKEINSIELLTPNRLDVCFKIFFLKYRNHIEISHKLYKDHIYAITNGSIKEYGKPEKNDISKFLKSFLELEKSLLKNKFDQKISILPIGTDNTVLDGAHRLSISVMNSLKVKTQKFKIKDSSYNWNFFLKRGIRKQFIEYAAKEFCIYNKNSFAAIIWPVSKDFSNDILKEFSEKNIIYLKKIKLNNFSIKNILIQVYKDHSWLGNTENGYDGIISKFSKIYETHGELTLIFFTSNSFDKVSILKEKIRSIVGIGKHSIHITDNQKETEIVADIFLNKNALEFYNSPDMFKFINSYKLLNTFKKTIIQKGLNLNNFILVGSLPFSLQGYIKANDLDYITNYDSIKFKEPLNSHNDYLDLYDKRKNEMIFNPEFHFIFDGIKILSNDLNLNFKKNRGELKDKILIRKYAKSISISLKILEIVNYITSIKYKIIVLIIKYSKVTGTYEFLKNLYKTTKKL